eukprot:4523436-Ditylum_brightwellii.AAC.1
MERSKQNKHVGGDRNNGVDENVDDSFDDSVENSDDSADKHLTHPSQVIDCCQMERSKQIKSVVGNKDNGVDNSDENSVNK